eukprot:NODE_4402_length_348_cov_304.712375_g3799_i0.p1 GENE.NODE_4402_length_348_cov_304.712375_g3799_i0~~NODE_4402_length_348_cov_304.712375_g3799_i0.p1  ORF type:complete len:90 (+),score=29.01 NODE_4402_length_348_cov_304.712375_g3799_i0:34-270(+)
MGTVEEAQAWLHKKQCKCAELPAHSGQGPRLSELDGSGLVTLSEMQPAIIIRDFQLVDNEFSVRILLKAIAKHLEEER